MYGVHSSFLLNHLYGEALSANKIGDAVIAYRSLDKSTAGFVKDVADFIKTKDSCAVLCFDVEAFFDTINHDILKDNWLRVIRDQNQIFKNRLPDDHFSIFKNATKYRFVEIERLRAYFPNGRISSKNGKYLPDSSLLQFVIDTDKSLRSKGQGGLIAANSKQYGIPQGLPISGVLANVSMLDFDLDTQNLAQKCNGIYRRYSDDIIIVVDASAAALVEQEVYKSLAAVKLKPNISKTEAHYFRRNIAGKLECRNPDGSLGHLQYLGLEFDGESFFIRSQSIARFYRRLLRFIGRAAWTHKERGGKVLRHRMLYRKFTTMTTRSDCGNFLTYAMSAHEILGQSSKIGRQLSNNKIMTVIKKAVKKRMSK